MMERSRSAVMVVALVLVAAAAAPPSATESRAMPFNGTLHALVNRAQRDVVNCMSFQFLLRSYHLERQSRCGFYPQDWPDAQDPAVMRVLGSGTLRFCHNPNNCRPFDFGDCKNCGFEKDFAHRLATAISEHYGTRVSEEFVEVLGDGVFRSIHTALKAGLCDVGLSSMFITPERWAQADFGCPYARVQGGLLRSERDMDWLHLSSIRALDDQRVHVGYVLDSWVDNPKWLRANLPLVPPAHRHIFRNLREGYKAVLAGEVHALLSEFPELQSWRFQHCLACDVVPFPPREDLGWFTLSQ
eukprot:TRINITY_DN3463_c0_g1_i1.p1 TRINITY_DN3463_c0_g1~~TRINITY_DN3463_c0_g1_i1.p1  ORF type:complete len:300 (-),score=80.93 TRINITY_DN3463_c0_g1_i1:129-1028(-)